MLDVDSTEFVVALAMDRGGLFGGASRYIANFLLLDLCRNFNFVSIFSTNLLFACGRLVSPDGHLCAFPGMAGNELAPVAVLASAALIHRG
jgi:hypothetical protein